MPPTLSKDRKWHFFAIDFILVLISAFGAYLIRENFHVSEMFLLEFTPYALLTATGAAFGFLIFGTHRSVWKFVSLVEIVLVVKAVTLGLAFALIVVFAINRLDYVARSVPIIHWGLAIAFLVSARLAIRFHRSEETKEDDHKHMEPPEYVLVVGLNRITELYLRCVSDLASKRISVAGILVEDPTAHGKVLRSCEVLGSPMDLLEILGKCNIHGISIKKVVITTQFSRLSPEVRETLQKYARSGIVELDFFETRLGFSPFPPIQQPATIQANANALATKLQLESSNDNEAGLRGRTVYRIAKRSFDFVGSLAALIILSPALLIASIIAAVDVGWPILFWQVRPGLHGRPFRVSKFRTMGPGIDSAGNRIPDEERVSRFGKLQRRLRFDEIPQLVNILLGDMSFVGPRPLLPIDQPDNRELRLSVRPGLTGWAQINGGKDLSIVQKTQLDLWYVKNASFALDAKILLLTAYFLVNGNIANEESELTSPNPHNQPQRDANALEKHKALSG